MEESIITIKLPNGSEQDLAIQPETVVEELERDSKWIIAMKDLKDQWVELPFRFNDFAEASEMADAICPARLERRGMVRINIFAQYCVQAGEASPKPTGDTETYEGTPEQLLEDALYMYKYADNSAGGDREYKRKVTQTLALHIVLEYPNKTHRDKADVLDQAGFQLRSDGHNNRTYAGINDEFFLVIWGNALADVDYIDQPHVFD
jgi:hypothetical protein